MPSVVWNYFDKLDLSKARCKIEGCSAVLTYLKGMSGLNYHLKSQHGIEKQNESLKRPTVQDEVQKRQRKMPEFIVKPTFGEEIARLVAVDNLSFNQIVKSSFIRQSLILKYPGQIVPKDNKGVSAALMKFYDYKETDLKGIIKDMLNQEKKFSATLDEWTSVGNSRFLNINIHYTVDNEGKTSHHDLGLIKIKGSCKAESLVVMVSDKNLNCSSIFQNEHFLR